MQTDIIQGLEHEVVVPKETDYHGHSNYLKIYLILLGLFVLTVVASLFHDPMIIFIMVFTISIIKGSLVLLHFMHLKWEPSLIWLLLFLALVVLLFMIVGFYPDITPTERFLIPKP